MRCMSIGGSGGDVVSGNCGVSCAVAGSRDLKKLDAFFAMDPTKPDRDAFSRALGVVTWCSPCMVRWRS